MAKFKVGDLVRILANPNDEGEEKTLVGTVATVDEPLHFVDWEMGEAYGLDNGWHVIEDDLEIVRPDPPREQLGEWDLCPWRPERATVGKDGGR